MKKLLLLSCIVAVCATFTACDSESDIEKKPGSSVLAQKTYPEPSGEYNSWTEISLDAESAASAVNANKFAFNIFRTATISSSGDDNMAISPLSIPHLPFHACQWRRRRVERRCTGAAWYDGGSDNLSKLNRFAGIMLSRVAESGWTHHVPVLPILYGIVPDWNCMQVSVMSLPRHTTPKTSRSARQEFREWIPINKWVSRYTEGNIRQFMKKPAENDMAVVNAVHFYSKWTTKFNKEKRESRISAISTIPSRQCLQCTGNIQEQAMSTTEKWKWYPWVLEIPISRCWPSFLT